MRPTARIGVPAAPAPAERLARAQRLGHRIEARHLPAPGDAPIQRYYTTAQMVKAKGVPLSARISENLKIVAIGGQTVWAADDKIDEANKVLGKGSKIVLDAGEKRDIDLELPPDPKGFSTISFSDYYEVIPRYNPNLENEGGDTPRDVSPEKGEDPLLTQKKHQVYAHELKKIVADFTELQQEVQKGVESSKYALQAGGLATTEPTEWYGAAGQWAGGNELRRLALKLGLNEIAGAYMVDKDVKKRAVALYRLGKSLEQFVLNEIRVSNRIALPTDCGQVVAYVVTGGKTQQDDTLTANPGVGSNYYTKLPSNAATGGWNYHWAGVILKDGGDNVTLESAGGLSLGSIGKASWWMQMYGTKNVDQTFKKQLHLLHVTRDRQSLLGQEKSEKTQKAEEQLLQHRDKVLNWTRFDSDQE